MRSKALTLSAAVLALGLTAACGGGSDSGEAQRLLRPDQDLAVEQPRGDRLGQGDGQGVERRPLRREGHRAGDPGRQDLRGGHRCGHHRRQRAVPGLQHQPRRRAAVPEAGRPGRARRASRTARTYVEARSGDAAEQYASPDGKFYQIPWKQNPVMIFYNKDHLQEGGPRPGQAAAGQLRRLPGRQQEDRGQRRRSRGHRAGAEQRVLPVLVRLLPAVRRRVGGQADHRGRQGHLRRPGRQGRLELLGGDVRRRATPPRRSTTATPSPTRRPRWPSSARGPSRSTRTR